MKKIFLIGLFLLLFSNAFSQGYKKIYFLADTVNVSASNRFLKIETISFFEHHFTFFCKCSPPYKSYVSFSYINKKGAKKSEIVTQKPDYPYISFKELMDMSGKYYNSFDSYDLYITEVLPGNKYRTDLVNFVPYRAPINDGVIIKDKQ